MWEQIQDNKQRSAALIVLMSAVLILTGYAAGVALAGPDGGVLGIFIALVVFAVMMGVYFLAAESVLLAGAGAREIDREDSPRLFNIVEEMKLAAGLPYMPRIYLVDDPRAQRVRHGAQSRDQRRRGHHGFDVPAGSR